MYRQTPCHKPAGRIRRRAASASPPPHEQDYLALWADIKAAEAASRNDLAGNFYRRPRPKAIAIVPAIANPTYVAYADPDKRAERRSPGKRATPSPNPRPAAIGSTRKQVSRTRDSDPQRTATGGAGRTRSAAERSGEAGDTGLPHRQRTRQPRTLPHRASYYLPVDAALVETRRRRQAHGPSDEFHGPHRASLTRSQYDRKQLANGERLLPDLRHLTARNSDAAQNVPRRRPAAGRWHVGYNRHPLQRRKLTDFIAWVQEKRIAKRIKRWLGLTVKKDVADKPIELIATILAQCGLTFGHKRTGTRCRTTVVFPPGCRAGAADRDAGRGPRHPWSEP